MPQGIFNSSSVLLSNLAHTSTLCKRHHFPSPLILRFFFSIYITL